MVTAVAAALALGFAAQAFGASGAVRGDLPDAELSAPMSASERTALAKLFVERWGGHVQSRHDVSAVRWADRMASTFAAADPASLRRALWRDSFDAATSELIGSGRNLRDERLLEAVARHQVSSAAAATGAAAGSTKAIGSLGGDLSYTAVTPCRIVDTRIAAGGALAASTTRSFVGIGAASYASQGGSGTDCGVLNVPASALALQVTAVTPGNAGYATVYPFGAVQPLAASVNYTAGAIVNNTVIVGIPNPKAASDFTIYTFAQSHYVVDIVGYFAPPQATSLQCTQTSISQAVSAATFDIQIPNCPTGYTLTGAGCRTLGFNDADWAINGLFYVSWAGMVAFCSGINKVFPTTITVDGTARCCRVPGR